MCSASIERENVVVICITAKENDGAVESKEACYSDTYALPRSASAVRQAAKSTAVKHR